MTTIDQQEGITENLTNTTKSFIFTEAKTTRYHRASGLVLPLQARKNQGRPMLRLSGATRQSLKMMN
jgi:hypothetical protein